MTIQPDLCGCYYCSPCFELSIDVQLKNSFKPLDKKSLIRCLRCLEKHEKSCIVPSDCRKVSRDLEKRFNSATYDIFASKRAHAADMRINTCKQCRTKARIPKPQKEPLPNPNISPRKTKGIYKCPGPRCKLIYCSICGQCIYNRFQFGLHKCS